MLLARALPEGGHGSHELVARYNRGLTVSFPVFVPPEERRSQVTFEVAGAYAHRINTNDDLTRPRIRYVVLF
tara:strand:- start:1020 stop:1235 length:216 start_codon:yes stop_codon:yes gene_type:complete